MTASASNPPDGFLSVVSDAPFDGGVAIEVAPPGRIVDSVRAAALTHLCSVRATNDNRVPGAVLQEMAVYLGVGVPHLRRMLRDFMRAGTIRQRPPGNPHKILLPDVWRAQVMYFVHKGCAASTYKALRESGHLDIRMDLRTFQRRVNEWDPALRACAKGGYRDMVKHQFFNVEHIPYRGYAFGTDHTFLPIQVLPDRGSTKPMWPWLTTLIDLKTRVVLAYLLTMHTPNTRDSLSTLLEGIHGWYTPEGDFVGGKPEFIRSDRGGDYISEALAKNLINLDVGRQFTEPYSSWQNGRVEALNGTIDQEFAPGVPGFHFGGEAEYTRRVLKTPLDAKSLITFDALDRRLGEFFGEYNNRPHSALNGLTPLEAWVADDQPIARADAGTLRHAMPSRETRRLNHYGIEIRGAKYSHPGLGRLRRENVTTVEVRYHQHDMDHIEVFVEGVHECTAMRTSIQPEHQKLGVLSMRAKQRRQAEALMRGADFQRVLAERERLREEGVDEAEWPALPQEVANPEAEPGFQALPDPTRLPDDAGWNSGFGSALSKPETDAWLDRLNSRDTTSPNEEGAA